MKKFLLSLATLLTLGMASASAETIFDANFADATYPASPGATILGNTDPSTNGAATVTNITIGDYTFNSSGVQWRLDNGIAVLGTKRNPDWYPYPSFIANNVVFENGNLINEIAITMYLRLSGSVFQELTGSLELYNDVTFSDLVGEAIPFTFELGLDAPKTFTISIPESSVSSGLYYKLNFNTVENSTGDNSGAIAISSIQYNSVSGEVTPPVTEAIATPTFSPAAGAVEAGTQVSISCTTDEATIYYTTNGDEPTEESTEYTTPITVNEAMTIKAIAVKDGMDNSAIAEAAYTIKPGIEVGENQALFNFSSASWLTANEIALPTAGEPTVVTNEAYTQSPITVTFSDPQNYASSNASVTNESGAYLLLIDSSFGFKISASDNYYITNVKFDYAKTNQLVLDRNSSGNFEDGVWTPKQEGDEVQELTFYPMQNCSINYFIVTYAQAEGEIQVAAPVFEPAAGEVESGTEVIITCATEGATIYYTTDGTDPTAESTEYTEAFTITEDITIKAIAVKDGCADSEIVTAEYTVKTGGSSEDTLIEATFNFTDGEWLTAQGITLPASGSKTDLDEDGQDFTADAITLTIFNEWSDQDWYIPYAIASSGSAYVLDTPFGTTLSFNCAKDYYLSSIDLDFLNPGSYDDSITVLDSNSGVDGEDGDYSDGTWTAGDLKISQLQLDVRDDDITIKTITVKYTKSVGVDNIDVDADAAPVYYNLQGVRIANPEKGIYIMVKGNKATKVIF